MGVIALLITYVDVKNITCMSNGQCMPLPMDDSYYNILTNYVLINQLRPL